MAAAAAASFRAYEIGGFFSYPVVRAPMLPALFSRLSTWRQSGAKFHVAPGFWLPASALCVVVARSAVVSFCC